MHGGEQQASFFAQLSVRPAAQGNSTKATVLYSILWQAKSPANALAFIARSISEATTMDLLEG